MISSSISGIIHFFMSAGVVKACHTGEAEAWISIVFSNVFGSAGLVPLFIFFFLVVKAAGV
jgi:hypothetical protein